MHLITLKDWSAEDLAQVRGIGPAIAQRIAQHLVLPSRGD